MQDSDNLDSFWNEVKGDVIIRLEAIIEALEGKIADRISHYKPYPIYATGEFLDKLTHSVTEENGSLIARIWSDAHSPEGEKYAKYVLGGRVPSDTPIKPLIAWVERKKLAWFDRAGNKLTAEQIAYIVREKIRRVGVKERNVFQEVLKEQMNWIESELNKLSKGDTK